VKLKLKKGFKLNKAFTLIEISIYMALLAFLVTILFGFLNKTQKNLAESAKGCEQFVRLSTALDLLKRDLASASNIIADWDVQNFVFKKLMLNSKNENINKIVGWQILKQGLCRIEGEYDFVRKKWGKRIISFVGKEIEELNADLILTKCNRFISSIVISYRCSKVGNIITGKSSVEPVQETITLANKFF